MAVALASLATHVPETQARDGKHPCIAQHGWLAEPQVPDSGLASPPLASGGAPASAEPVDRDAEDVLPEAVEATATEVLESVNVVELVEVNDALMLVAVDPAVEDVVGVPRLVACEVTSVLCATLAGLEEAPVVTDRTVDVLVEVIPVLDAVLPCVEAVPAVELEPPSGEVELSLQAASRPRMTNCARHEAFALVTRSLGRAAGRRTPNAERRTPNAERRTPNAERHPDGVDARQGRVKP